MGRPRKGSIKEVRPGVWQVRASVGRTKSGMQRRVKRTVHGTHADAERERLRLLAEMGASPLVGDEVRMREYLYSVFIPARTGLTRATLDRYESIYRIHIDPVFGDMKPSEITRPMVQAWLSKQPPASARNHMRAMSAILHGAVEDGFLDNPPMLSRMRYPRRPLKDPTADSWTPSEVMECFTRLEGDRIYDLWLTMVGAGLSRSEACALEWADVSEVDGWAVVMVTKARTEKDGLKEPKNRFRARSVPVMEPFGSKLLSRKRSGSLWEHTPAYAGVYWKKLFKGVLEGMSFVHLNRMRATHETMLQSAGVLDSMNARIHGRSNVQTGYEHYQATSLMSMIEALAGCGIDGLNGPKPGRNRRKAEVSANA